MILKEHGFFYFRKKFRLKIFEAIFLCKIDTRASQLACKKRWMHSQMRFHQHKALLRLSVTRFGEIVPLWKILNFKTLWAIFGTFHLVFVPPICASAQIFFVLNDFRLNNNLVIWSHCSNLQWHSALCLRFVACSCEWVLSYFYAHLQCDQIWRNFANLLQH